MNWRLNCTPTTPLLRLPLPRAAVSTGCRRSTSRSTGFPKRKRWRERFPSSTRSSRPGRMSTNRLQLHPADALSSRRRRAADGASLPRGVHHKRVCCDKDEMNAPENVEIIPFQLTSGAGGGGCNAAEDRRFVRGIDLSLRNDDGETLFDVAESQGDDGMIEYGTFGRFLRGQASLMTAKGSAMATICQRCFPLESQIGYVQSKSETAADVGVRLVLVQQNVCDFGGNRFAGNAQ